MEDIISIIKKYVRKKYVPKAFYEIIDSYYQVNELTVAELKIIKRVLASFDVEEIFDDFLKIYIQQRIDEDEKEAETEKDNKTKFDYNSVLDLLEKLNYKLNRRLIITLISLNIINYNNISSIDDKNVQKYFDILKGSDTFDYDVNTLQEHYRNIKCLTDNYYNYLYIQARSIPLLDEFEELKLLFDYKFNKAKKKEARDYLLLSNLKLVMLNANIIYNIKISDGYYGTEVDDLFTYGLFGLIEAIDKYDIYSGKKFSTYATRAIRRSMNRESLKDRMIVLPENLSSKPYENPFTGDDAIKLDNAFKQVVSLSEPVTNHGSASDEDLLVDFISYDNSLVKDNMYNISVEDKAMDNVLKEAVDEACDKHLTQKENKVIHDRFGLDDGVCRTLEEVRQDLDVSREGVRQIEERAKKKLEKTNDIQNLQSYIYEDIVESIKEEPVVEEEKFEEVVLPPIPKTKTEIKREKLTRLKKEVDKLLAVRFGQEKLDVLKEYNSYQMLTNFLLKNEGIVDSACKSIGGTYGGKEKQ